MHTVYTIDQLRRVLKPIFHRNNINRAILFGSYGKGLANEHSDVDLLVDSGLHGLAFFGLVDDVCESLKCNVDLIDVRDLIPDSRIDREIRNSGVVIYER